MTHERDDFDVFLDSWVPGPLLEYATLSPNIHDPLIHQRLVDDGVGVGALMRTPFSPGTKIMDDREKRLRGYEFFERRQPEWSAHFRDHVLSAGVAPNKLDTFIASFAKLWINGRSRRQNSAEMMAIKASLRNYDRICDPAYADRFVIHPVSEDVAPLLDPSEMAAILSANEGLLQAFMPDYLDHLGGDSGSLDELYVRRGVYLPGRPDLRIELYQLSSYSIALGPVEQFAQTWTPETRDVGTASIFSAPLSAVHHRVVAFAPFIAGMDLSQLELVLAPPIAPTPLRHLGEHGGIHEYEFE